MPGIDAHQHFWNYDPVRDSWITGDMQAIRKDFLPADLAPILSEHQLHGTIVVQSDQSEEENRFQLANAAAYDFIKGVVGWVDLQASDVEDHLAYYHSFNKMKGFRHVLQGEPRRDLLLAPAFKNGISKLEKFGFTYDILIFPDQLIYLPALVAAFPNQLFVIDHMAKPLIRDKTIDPWKKEIEAVAQFENVYCKLSGLVTEADWQHWQPADFTPYLDTVVNAFGMKRLLYGSDWPVCELAGGYAGVISIVKNYFSDFSQHEQDLFFGENATRFYNLE